MSTPTTPAVEAAPPAASPTPQPETFVSAMDAALTAAFQKMDAKPEPTPEPVVEATPEPVAQEKATKTAKKMVKAVADTKASLSDLELTDKPDAPDKAEEPVEVEEATPESLLESLTDEFEDWTPKAAARFKEIKAELKEHKAQLETERQKIKEYEQKVLELSGKAESADVAALREQVSAYEKKMALTSLEDTAAYQEAVTKPLGAILGAASELGQKYGVDQNSLIELLSTPESDKQEEMIGELFPDITAREQAKLFRLLEDMEPIARRKQELHDNAGEALKEAQLLEEQRARQVAAQAAEARKEATDTVLTKIREKLPFLASFEGLDLDEVGKKASASDPTVVHPVDYAYNAVSAHLLPQIVKAYMGSQKEIEALTERLAEFDAAEPRASTARASGGVLSPTDGLSFVESVNRALSSAAA